MCILAFNFEYKESLFANLAAVGL